ncbi:MAG: hypothetical protein RLZZ387_391 [Chloroflexota bacterium]|jgi:hypothetical protein
MTSVKDTVGYALAQVCRAHFQGVDTALRSASRATCCDAELHVGREMILLQLGGEEGLRQSQLAN